jgi:hypothetical protein
MSFYVLTWQNFQKRTRPLQDRIGEITGVAFNQYPGVFTGLAIIAAITAYLFLLLFPVLVLTALYQLYHIISADAVDWIFMLIWLTIGLLSAYVSNGLVRVKIVPPAGLHLSKDSAPELFELIESASENFVRPDIDRVVITGDYELDIRKVPRWFLPVWSSNVLVIGLPVLLCHTPEHFACMVNRRIGQFSKRHNPVTNWVYQLRSIWPMYHLNFASRGNTAVIPHTSFYTFLLRLYCVMTTTTARKEELNADSYAMQVYHDEVVLEMISADELYRYYLQNNYWPAAEKIIAMSSNTKLTPYAKMQAAVRNRLKEDHIARILSALSGKEPMWKDQTPFLKNRLVNIGHSTPQMEQPEGDCAAAFYLGESGLELIEEFDRRWLSSRTVAKA